MYTKKILWISINVKILSSLSFKKLNHEFPATLHELLVIPKCFDFQSKLKGYWTFMINFINIIFFYYKGAWKKQHNDLYKQIYVYWMNN